MTLCVDIKIKVRMKLPKGTQGANGSGGRGEGKKKKTGSRQNIKLLKLLQNKVKSGLARQCSRVKALGTQAANLNSGLGPT